MNVREAKKDAAQRLAKAGISYEKLQAKSVSFEDLARCSVVYVYVVNPSGSIPELVIDSFDIPKPSKGGYILDVK